MKDIDKYINSVIKIQYIIRNYIKQLHKLPLIIYNKIDINYNSINSFQVDIKDNNDKNNKIREIIIGAINNNKIKNIYYIKSHRWHNLRNNINIYIDKLDNSINKNKITLIHKGGRKYNYDFNMIIDDNIYKIEFKFNIDKICNSRQYVVYIFFYIFFIFLVLSDLANVSFAILICKIVLFI